MPDDHHQRRTWATTMWIRLRKQHCLDIDPDDQACVSTTANIEVGEHDHVVPDGDGSDIKLTLTDDGGIDATLIA